MHSVDFDKLGSDFYFLNIIIFAIISASIGLASYWVAYFWAFTAPVMIYFSASMFFSMSNNEFSLLAATLVFFFYLRQIVYTYHSSIIENILLRERVETMAADLEKRKTQAEQLAESRKNFLASASHDLRQPLQAMNLFLSALKPYIAENESRIIFDKLEDSTDGMNDLLSQILDISKLDSNTLNLNITTFNLQTLIHSLEQEFRDQAEDYSLEFCVKPIDVLVRNDILLLHRVLANLIANAINYTPSGSICLDCSNHNGRIEIDVIDTGSGIAFDQQERVFDEFFQVGNLERDRKKGLGLGLSIVKRLCPILNVDFEFESRPKEGSRFTIIIDQEFDSKIEPLPETNNSDCLGQNATVLIIDDDESVLDGLATLFKHWQFEVCIATSAKLACELLENTHQTPDLIISDYRLRSGLTGVQAIHQIRELLSDATIPALIISGDTAPERLGEVAQSGHLLLHKPVKPAFLRAAVQRLLAQRTL
jgi:signal transduction histidine kinase